MTRSEPKLAGLQELGAEPVIAEARNPDQVADAVAQTGPEVIVHQLTAIGSLTGDGGGKVPALARSLHGRNRAARTLHNWLRLGAPIPGGSIRPVEVNQTPGALLLDGEGRVVAVWTLQIADGQIQRINSIVNPDKLAHLGRVASLKTLLERSAAPGDPA